MYESSRTYCEQAGACNTLALQLVVDDFNRHYVYRHDLTTDIVRDTYEQLCLIQTATQEAPLNEPMVLEYHLLLLEYLHCLMTGSSAGKLQSLLVRVKETIAQCVSPFYAIKLQVMEIYILIGLNHISKAVDCLSSAFDFAYKKELRVHIYRLTYIKTQLLLFQNGFSDSTEVYHQATLALAQMLDTHGKAANNLRREIFLLVQLGQIIAKKDPERLANLACHQEKEAQALLQALIAYLQGKHSGQTELFEMKSYFAFEGLNFPTI